MMSSSISQTNRDVSARRPLLSLDEEIGSLKKTYLLQRTLNNPLRFLTGTRLYIKLGERFGQQHKYDQAIEEYWKAISSAESRIEELLQHSRNGFVGEVPTESLIQNSKDYIKICVHKIAEFTLAKHDIINRSIETIVSEVVKDTSKNLRQISKIDTLAEIQRAVLSFAGSHIYKVLANDENFEFVTNEENFSLLQQEELYRQIIRVYRCALKEIRSEAHIDKQIATRCYWYRSRCAYYYKLLDDTDNYYGELSSAWLYKTYASNSLQEYEQNYAQMEKVLSAWEETQISNRREPFYRRAFASVFGLNFLDSSDIKSRIKHLKLINYYFSQTKLLTKTTYLLYENLYVLIDRINRAKRFEDVKLPDQKPFKFPDTIKSEVQEARSCYRSLVKLVQYINGKKITSLVTHPDLASILQLYSSGVISEHVAFGLTKSAIKAFLGEEIISQNILDEEQDEKLITELLRLGETGTIEAKRSLSDYESIGQAISAFANTRGGKILVGFEELEDADEYSMDMVICNDFVIVGIKTGGATVDDQKKRLALHLHDAGIDVGDLVIDSSLTVRGKRVCVIEVPDMSGIKPVFYRQEMYVRVDAQNRRLKTKEVLARISSTGAATTI